MACGLRHSGAQLSLATRKRQPKVQDDQRPQSVSLPFVWRLILYKPAEQGLLQPNSKGPPFQQKVGSTRQCRQPLPPQAQCPEPRRIRANNDMSPQPGAQFQTTVERRLRLPQTMPYQS